MPEVLVVPLKKPSDVDIVKPLKNLIQSAYNSASDQQTADYSDAVNAFSKLRGEALWKAFDKSEVSLELLSNYYDQICSLETKIPAQELQVPFKWKDAFDKGSIFGGRQSLTLSSLSFEKVCILFNIGALLSALAAAENLDSDDGLKLAAKYFQKAAGIFNHLRGVSPAAIPQQPTQDLAAETLTVMSSLMAAQAQEMFIHKAIRDNMKDQIIANLCCQCEEMYADVLRGMQKEAVRSLWEKEWVPLVAGKQAAYHAMTQFYQSLVCRAKKSVGAEIALLQDAVELFKSAQSRSGKADLFEEFAAKAQRNLTESKKDNDFIYNEMIPDVKTLPACGKVQLAKPLPVTTPIGSSFKDLFAELVPVAVHRAMAICDQRKTEGVNQEIMKLREASLKMNSLLASHNLPAAIEVTDCGSLPQSLLDKTRSVREQGGVDSIRSLLTELPELLNRNREILDECERVLNEEQQSDHKLRAQFKEKWTRTPSEKLTELFRSNAEKYRVIINNAVQADKVVRDKFETHSHGFEMLSKDENALQQATPSGSGVDIASCSAAQKLRSLMEQVETIKVEREVIESELKSVTVDMREEFLKALAQDGAIDENALTATHVGQAINPLRKQVDDSLARQAALENEINAAQQEFQTQTGGGSNGSRDDFFKELASAYDSFTELKTNLQEGTKFYNDLTNILVVFQNKITDFCFARKTEKDELMKDLTQQSSRTAPAVAPQAPSHFGSTTDGSGGSVPQRTAPPAPTDPAYAPYPTQMQGMPMPYGATAAAPYPTYVAPPMPQAFYPYATLPYPTNAYAYPNFPQGPQPPQGYNTYPGNYGNQPQPPQWPPQ